MTTWQSLHKENQEMVDKFTRLAIIQSKEVENAFRCVSRAAFVSKELLDESFLDAPIRGSPHIHMSAPHMYAAILEDLELEPGMSFLNIGSGTGYFSCLSGYLLKPHGINHGVELHDDLVAFSHEKVQDFLKSGPSDAAEICPPLLISGNAFQLDPVQMKYDRLYCGGACPQTTVTFFLEFLKVGGFLIAPVGTKLIKLERVSHQEGVKTVISDVCFAPLTRLDSSELSKLRNGLLPLLRFPIKTKKKPKKTIFGKMNFPMSTSPARKKLTRLRAIQHALDSLEDSRCIPSPFCYVPNIDQINAYKHYKKAVECKGVSSTNVVTERHLLTSTSNASSSVSPQPASAEERNTLLNALRQSYPNEGSSTSQGHLMTIQEFLTAASPDSIFQEFLNGSRNDPSTENGENSAFNRLRLLSTHDYRASGNSDDSSNENIVNNISERRGESSSTSGNNSRLSSKPVVEYTDHNYELQGKVSKDIWEHLCSDRLWETVVDYYYSVCATSKERKDECFKLKGVEIVHPAVARLADALLFKMSKNKSKRKKSFEIPKNLCANSGSTIEVNSLSALDDTINPDVNSPSSSYKKSSNFETEYSLEIKDILNDLIEKVCTGRDDNRQFANTENLDSVADSPPRLRASSDENILLDSSFDTKKDTKDDSDKTTIRASTKRKEKSSRYLDIKTDNKTAECISKIENVNWTPKHDIELISFLSSFGKDTDANTLRDVIPKDLTVDVFDQSKLIKFPSLSSIDPELLCYRSIGLLRITKILDSVLDILIGPSLQRSQFSNPFKEEFPLPSFLDSSFDPSDSRLNVFEAKSDTSKRDGEFHQEKEEKEKVLSYEGPKSTEDEELMKEVTSMIEYELSNVKQQQLILMKKLNLIESIEEQYKEQVKLLNQQLLLIDEQQKLLFGVHTEAGNSEEVAVQMATSQQLVTERKQQRQRLLAKRNKINEDRGHQLMEKKEILTMLEQLLTLESGLNTEITIIKKKGMAYVSSFSKFVRKADVILKRLKASSANMINQVDGERKEVKETKKRDTNARSKRYQPDTILSRCRFLMPLSKKRYNYVKEMLRSTERSSPKHMPVINVDRRIPLGERHIHGVSSTVFMQIYVALKKVEFNYRWNKKSYDQWWEVKFNGEGIIDQGGGFRDSLTELAEELCPASADTPTCLPLFIKTPNQVSGIGDNLDSYTLNPNCKQFHLYRWLGQLFGACFRSDETIPLALPPLLWKLLVGEFVSWKDDFVHIDEAAVKNIDGLENLDEEAYKVLNMDQTYSTTLSDQSTFQLVPCGSDITVKCNDRVKYSKMVRKARMMENIEQVKALREGLKSVVPEAVLSCLTWKNLERCVCGCPTISVSDLKSNCRYEDRLSPSSTCVLNMWSAVSSFSDDERSRFLRFITGRKRLPSPFIVFRGTPEHSSSNALPSASTCGSSLFLPDYKDAEVAKERIRYAIYNCVAIDTDTSPW